MTKQHLKNLIASIKNPDIIVMWNDGYDKYIILNNIVHEYDDDELRVNFKDFIDRHVDLYNCSKDDFLIFQKEK